ncbi:MAG: hypothetical protein CMH54_11370 [Myxococcales bacterium]|nr:hypothetical protein [Myxococcales bacterium]|tara:strand:+ start:162 stop:737 length:576 start_codon:yes stop_codon:yes gene_type:complete
MNQTNPSPSEELSPGIILVFYGAMALGAWYWAGGFGEGGGVSFRTADAKLPWALAEGIGFGLAVVGVTSVLLRASEALRRVAADIRQIIGRPGIVSIALIAAASSVGEEMLFRGAMQSAWGFAPTVVVFGFVHGLPGTRYWAWGVFAFVVGIGLGLMTLHTGSILAATLAHFTINYINLSRLVANRFDEFI